MEPVPPGRLLPALRSHAGVAAALALAVLATYARTAGYPFIAFDDPGYVYENEIVRGGLSWASLGWAFSTFHLSNWHPLTWVSYLLDVSLFGASPGAMHLVNAALHAVNSALVFVVLARLTGARWRSAAVAALFALHPTRVESVAWISERKDLLFALFGLLALLAYDAYARRPSARRYLWVTVAFAASLLAKPMLVTLPFLLLLLDAWPLRRVEPWSAGAAPGAVPAATWGRAVAEKVPLLALSAGCAFVNVAAQSAWGSVLELPLTNRLGNAVVAYARYLGLLAWHVDLAVFYPLPAGGYSPWLVAACAALLLGASVAAARFASRAPFLALGWFWFLGTLVPVIGLLQVGWQAIADRYTYFPAIGVFIAAVWGLEAMAWRPARRLHAPAAAVALVCLSALGFRQVGFWSDNTTLFTHAMEVTGPTAKAHVTLAAGLREQGDLPRALEHAREATRLDPRDERSWFARAIIALGLGDEGEAEVALQGALAADPRYEKAYRLLASLRDHQGRLDEAAAALRAFLALVPEEGAAWGDLGGILHRLGRTGEAVAAFRAGVDVSPGDAVGWRNLGFLLAQQGDWQQAALALTRAASLRAEPDVLRELAHAQVQAGDRAGALDTAGRLAAFDPAAAAEVRMAVGAP